MFCVTVKAVVIVYYQLASEKTDAHRANCRFLSGAALAAGYAFRIVKLLTEHRLRLESSTLSCV
eukprot:scaffold94930_cov63-Phaeocystis_antarctica.AAC.3